jgi:hypothetical protein
MLRRSVPKVINHASHVTCGHSDDLRWGLVEVSLIYRESSLNFQHTFTSVVDNFWDRASYCYCLVLPLSKMPPTVTFSHPLYLNLGRLTHCTLYHRKGRIQKMALNVAPQVYSPSLLYCPITNQPNVEPPKYKPWAYIPINTVACLSWKWHRNHTPDGNLGDYSNSQTLWKIRS